MTATPTAAPMRSVAAAAPADAAAAPAAIPTVDAVAARIAASEDPTAELNHLVLSVSSCADSAAAQGALLHAVKATCDSMLRDVRKALLASVADDEHPDGAPGVYSGFTVTYKAGARSLSYTALAEQYPDVYAELVRVGEPTATVKYTP